MAAPHLARDLLDVGMQRARRVAGDHREHQPRGGEDVGRRRGLPEQLLRREEARRAHRREAVRAREVERDAEIKNAHTALDEQHVRPATLLAHQLMPQPDQRDHRARLHRARHPAADAPQNAGISARAGLRGERPFQQRLRQHGNERMAPLHGAAAPLGRVVEVYQQRAYESLDFEALAHVRGEWGQRGLEPLLQRLQAGA